MPCCTSAPACAQWQDEVHRQARQAMSSLLCRLASSAATAAALWLRCCGSLLLMFRLGITVHPSVLWSRCSSQWARQAGGARLSVTAAPVQLPQYRAVLGLGRCSSLAAPPPGAFAALPPEQPSLTPLATCCQACLPCGDISVSQLRCWRCSSAAWLHAPTAESACCAVCTERGGRRLPVLATGMTAATVHMWWCQGGQAPNAGSMSAPRLLAAATRSKVQGSHQCCLCLPCKRPMVVVGVCALVRRSWRMQVADCALAPCQAI